MRFLGQRRTALGVAALAAFLMPQESDAQQPLKIGLILPMTGPTALVGRQAYEGAKLYLAQKGNTLAGKRIELLVQDDGGRPDQSRAAAQKLVEQDKVDVLGVTSTPGAFAIAPFVTSAKIPTIVMGAVVTGVNATSPYFVRTSYTLDQPSKVLGEWLAKNGSKSAAIIEVDTTLAAEAGAAFRSSYTAAGGKLVTNLRVPFSTEDFTPFLQTVRGNKPDTLFAFVFPNQAVALARQFKELGFEKEGTKLVGLGELTDEEILTRAGESLLGVVTAGVYSPSHESPANKEFVAAFQKATNFRPNIIAVAGYDGMNLLDQALKKTGGQNDGGALIEAMKGTKWESPRGPVAIGTKSRQMVQNVYIRTVQKAADGFYNVEMAAFAATSSQPPACCVPKTCPDMKVCETE